MVELYNEVQRLRYHNGYPNRIHLRCPIWTQDKFDYLSAIANDGLCNPTYKIDLNIESLMEFAKRLKMIQIEVSSRRRVIYY